MTSIRSRLLATQFTAIVVALVIGGYGTYQLAWREVNELFDYQLRQLALAQREPSPGAAPAPADPLDAEFDFKIQVRGDDGKLRYRTDPSLTFPDVGVRGLTDIRTAEGSWRAYVAQRRNRTVLVAQALSVRERIAAATALHMLTPFLVLLPLLVALSWWLVGRGLRPLQRIASAVTRRSPAALRPLSLSGIPKEALPLAEALNDLLGRLTHAMELQRTFVADAAHELRTPLTALQLHLQLVARAGDDAERQEALSALRTGLERAIHVVHQLLTLARQEPGARDERPFEAVDLIGVAAQVVADHLRLAEVRNIDLGIAGNSSAVPVNGDSAALRTLVANLVDNALRYTPPGGRVDVTVRRQEGRVILAVRDTGPGIPPEERERVFDRFYRRSENADCGSGLGLAIVQAIAERHGADIRLDTADLGGLEIEVRLPIVAGA